MKFSAIATSLVCLAASQLVAAEAAVTTSTLTSTITKTLIRVHEVATSTAVMPSSTMAMSTTPAATSATPTATPTHTGAAVALGPGLPVALVAGSFALFLGAAL